MAREDLHFRLRIPEDMKKRIEASAEIQGRSMTAEIVPRLAESLNQDSRSRLAMAENEELRMKVAALEGYSTALQRSQDLLMEHLARAAAGDTVTYEEIKADLASMAIPERGTD